MREKEKGRKMFTRTTDIQPGVLQIIKVKNADLGKAQSEKYFIPVCVLNIVKRG